ncbi:type III secretion system effector protein exou [Pseudomonas azotoformans]|uniref:Type III secretion system effector protein exou n=1 Tax=Pseudomonas azotoformans TaxID=47878 RepID=A0A1V2JK80_PSEAZ|nr:patatin-like phospholipase family protein [Pseudomonas azotoformans]OIN47499.1 type III secretion system effector protein exou [Pseudomonas azotoformans]ONH45832.1 type III secretion system effector protein exou [Pseudomonas azotoformans]
MKVSSPHAAVQSQPRENVERNVKTSLIKNVGERKVSLELSSAGRVEVVLSPPPLTHLVLSGGGAKGTAFPGTVQALENRKALAGVKVISGSSAGAISAALLASGMDARTFENLSNSLNLPELLNSKNPLIAKLQNASAELGKLAGRLPGAAGNIAQLLFTLVPRLQTEAQPLEDLIGIEARTSLLAKIAGTRREGRPGAVMKIADRLSAGNGPTFRDLEVLSRHIPAVKQLNITGAGMFDGRPQLVVFNASTTPDMDIARAAHISGSLPGLFKSPNEQGHAFQEHAEQTAFMDGGLLVNTPSSAVIDPPFPESPLSKTESLVVKFESDNPEPAKSGSVGSGVVDTSIGVPHAAAEGYQEDKLKTQADQTVTLPLKSEKGDFRGMLGGTVNFTMTDAQKQHLQASARTAVGAHLERRAELRERYPFQSLDDAVLAMDDEMLASVENDLKKDPATKDVLMFRKSAQQAMQALDVAITEANQASEKLTVTPKLAAALRDLDALARRPEYVEWLGRRLNAAGKPNFQQLLQAMSKQSRGNTAAMSKVMTSAVAQMKSRDLAVKAENFTREVIYPSLYRPGQPAANVELLRGAARDLADAKTPQAFNSVLDGIVKYYKARNKPWSVPFRSSTVEAAKAWRIPV